MHDIFENYAYIAWQIDSVSFKASFATELEMFLRQAVHADPDIMRSSESGGNGMEEQKSN